jgi:hypothetical protein
LYALAVTQLSNRLAVPIYTGDIKHPIIILEAVQFPVKEAQKFKFPLKIEFGLILLSFELHT